jgi:exopolysaccharide biosynthesis polyprenyl glycosylphosphotransferase
VTINVVAVTSLSGLTDGFPPGLVAPDARAATEVIEAAETAVEETVLRTRAQFLHWRWVIKGAMVAGDLLAVTAAMWLAYLVRVATVGHTHAATERSELLLGAMSLPLWLLVFVRNRLYTARHVADRAEELRRLAHATAMCVLGMTGLAFGFAVEPGRTWLLMTFGLVLVLVLAVREVARRAFARLRTQGKLLRPVVIVGRNAEGLAISELLATERTLGYEVIGFVDDGDEERAHLFDRPVLGPLSRTAEVVVRSQAAGVIIATTAMDLETSNRLARELTDAGIHVELSSSLRDIATRRLSLHPLGQFSVMYVQPVSRSGWRHVAKRGFDVVVSLMLLALSAPLLAAVALLIKLTSPGAVIYRQERVGRGGRTFAFLKLRTMVVNAEALLPSLLDQNEAAGPLFKMRRDPRVTTVGRVLRKLSIDEVPQLWNVVRGDMSLVGPRPALPSEVTQWPPELHQRLRVQPGITGMWQVNGRTDSSFENYTRLDLYYVDNWSLMSDLAIMARTVPVVLRGHGAY